MNAGMHTVGFNLQQSVVSEHVAEQIEVKLARDRVNEASAWLRLLSKSQVACLDLA